MSAKKAKAGQDTEAKVSFFPAWCKRCGNCVAFCPRRALEADKWGHPRMADPERCTSCGLCQMLCPDFAIAVGEAEGERVFPAAETQVPPGSPGPVVSANHSPERLAQAPSVDEEDKGA